MEPETVPIQHPGKGVWVLWFLPVTAAGGARSPGWLSALLPAKPNAGKSLFCHKRKNQLMWFKGIRNTCLLVDSHLAYFFRFQACVGLPPETAAFLKTRAKSGLLSSFRSDLICVCASVLLPL